MKYSTVALVMVNAMLAMASPIAKRKVVYQYDVEVVTKYVYPDGSPATVVTSEPSSQPFVYHGHHDQGDQEQVAPEVTATPEPEPAPEPAAVPAPEPEPGAETEVQGANGGGLSDPGDDFIQNAIYHHNVHRFNHSVGAVTWSSDLADAANQLASSCHYGHDTSLGVGGYGQNIAMYAASNGLGSDVEFLRTSITEYWYNGEVGLYGNAYGGEPNMGMFEEFGHFTQIVWKESTQIGCAVAHCGAGSLNSYEGYFSVCNYNPAGNFPSKFGENVLPPLGEQTVTA